jgi:hypothetical protein
MNAKDVKDVKVCICAAVLAVPMLILQYGEQNRVVHYLEARGYSDVRIEHPTQFSCSRRDGAHSYRARSPSGTPVHGGACVTLFFIISTYEPIRKEWWAR